VEQLSFVDLEEEMRRKSWEELLPHSQRFLMGIHPDSPPPPKPESPYLRLLRALKQDQKDRFAPARKLGE